MSMPPPLNSKMSNNNNNNNTATTSTHAANDVFSRAPPPPKSQHTVVLPTPPGNIQMELPPRTSFPQVSPLPATIHQPNPHQLLPSTVSYSSSNSNSNSSSSSTNHTINTPSSLPSFFTDMNKSIDELADEFLMGPHSGRNHSQQQQQQPYTVVLQPDPLPAHVSDYERLLMLVQQRAYMDVLLYTRMLLEGSSSHYTALFDAIKHVYHHKNNNNNSNNSNHYTNTIELALDTHKRDLVDIMTIHITAMMKLNLFHEVIVELDTWSFCYHNHQYRQHKEQQQQQQQQHLSNETHNNDDTNNDAISWIPWKFHILAASTLQYRLPPHSTSKIVDPVAQQDCLDVLYRIRHAISNTKNTQSNNANNSDTISSLLHVENTLHNVHMSMKNYRMSLQCIQRMIQFIPDIVQEDIRQLHLHSSLNKINLDATNDDEENILRRLLSCTYQSEYLSRQGRILLQLGALDGASLIFDQIKMLLKDISLEDIFTATKIKQSSGENSIHSILFRILKAQAASNDGLLKFSRGKYVEALESFNTVVQELRSITSNSQDKKQPPTPPLIMESIRTNLYCETMNNMSLCALYTCRLQEGIQLLESLIRENVTTNFNERVTLNLCTMYELAMDTTAALRKKKILQCIATRFLVQDIPIECFRIG